MNRSPEGLRRERLTALVLRVNLEQATQSGARRNLNASSLRSGEYERTNGGSQIIQVNGGFSKYFCCSTFVHCFRGTGITGIAVIRFLEYLVRVLLDTPAGSRLSSRRRVL